MNKKSFTDRITDGRLLKISTHLTMIIIISYLMFTLFFSISAGFGINKDKRIMNVLIEENEYDGFHLKIVELIKSRLKKGEYLNYIRSSVIDYDGYKVVRSKYRINGVVYFINVKCRNNGEIIFIIKDDWDK